MFAKASFWIPWQIFTCGLSVDVSKASHQKNTEDAIPCSKPLEILFQPGLFKTPATSHFHQQVDLQSVSPEVLKSPNGPPPSSSDGALKSPSRMRGGQGTRQESFPTRGDHARVCLGRGRCPGHEVDPQGVQSSDHPN